MNYFKMPSIKLKHNSYIIILFLTLFLVGLDCLAQKNHIPLSAQLESNSKQELIRIGMINNKRPPKLKFGAFSTENRKGRSDGSKSKHQSIHSGEEQKAKMRFSFDLINDKGDSTRVEAFEQHSKTGEVTETSIYMSTNIDQEDLWILMTSPVSSAQELSVGQMIFTNGVEEIQFELVVGDPTGKSEVTAPRGIEALYEGNSIGAMQFYSGGSFSYKKFIWISGVYDDQIQMILAAAFSSIMELAGYFEETMAVE